MGISAFLSLPMAKEKEKVELRAVDEDAESRARYVRLGKDAAEELEELPPVRVGRALPLGRLDAATREELKTRSNEPDVGSLIEREITSSEDPWETPAVEGRTFPWGWVAVVACLFGAAIIWSLVNVNRAEERRQALTTEALAILEKEKQMDMDASDLIGALERVVRSFFDSRSVEEMRRFVRHPERVGPLMEGYYAAKAPVPVRVVRVLSLEPLTIDMRAAFWMVSCELEGGLQTQMLVEALSEKEARVDWETFVCYQPMEWDEFAKKRPGGYTGDFRVYAEKDHYYSHEFADSEAFDCYRLTALNGQETLYGYVNRSTDHARRIAELVSGREGVGVPMILRLYVPKGVSSPRGVVVLGLVGPRWLFVEEPGKDDL